MLVLGYGLTSTHKAIASITIWRLRECLCINTEVNTASRYFDKMSFLNQYGSCLQNRKTCHCIIFNQKKIQTILLYIMF